MSIDAVAAATQASASPIQQSLNQQDLIKLLLAQLSNQDPMQPVNNTQFLAQMAQFALLSEEQQSNANLQQLAFIGSASESMNLLGRQVQFVANSGAENGQVTAVNFTKAGPQLTVTASDGSVTTGVKLSQVNLVRK